MNMSYIDFLNGFWRLRNIEGISSHEAYLYFALLQIANLNKWEDDFSASLGRLESMTEMSRHTIIKARTRLIELGLIMFKEGGKGRGKNATYTLVKGADKCANKKCNNAPFNEEKGADKCANMHLFGKEKKENIPPTPPIKEKKEIYKEKKNLASLDTHDARARERVLILGEGDLKAIEQLRVSFSSRTTRETLMRQNEISSVEEYRSICDEILGEWSITKGEDFEITEDIRKYFINLVRRKSEKRKSKGDSRALTMAERDAERERKRAEQEAHDATAITFEEYMLRKNNGEDNDTLDNKG